MRLLGHAGRFRLGLLGFLLFVGLAWLGRIGRADQNEWSRVYPFDTFSMYAQSQPTASYLMLIDEDDTAHRVTDFGSFACDGPISQDQEVCDIPDGSFRRITYKDDETRSHIRAHAGEGTLRMRLVRRVWHVPVDGPPAITGHCAIATCMVAR